MVDWAPFIVKDLVKLILRLFILLTTWAAIHSTDSIVRLALARGILLVAGPSSIVVMLPIVVVVTAREAATLLLLIVCLVLRHVA